MNYETKNTENFSRNLYKKTEVLMRNIYDEIKLSDMLISQQEQTTHIIANGCLLR